MDRGNLEKNKTNKEKARNFMIKKINQDDLISKKHEKLCTTLY